MSDAESTRPSEPYFEPESLTDRDPFHPREGLPPDYQMRFLRNEHYVDEIEARRRTETAQSPLGASVASSIEASLHAILSTLGLLEKPESSLRDRVALGLIRSEAMRASRLLQAMRILGGDPPLIRRPVDFGALVQEVLGESEDERAFLAIQLDESLDGPSSVRADRELLSLAVSGALECVISVLRKIRGARLQVRLTPNPLSRSVSLVVAEEAVQMPDSSWVQWFDASWERRPGGHSAAVALLASRRAAELHGGRLEISPAEAGGVRLTLTVPEA